MDNKNSKETGNSRGVNKVHFNFLHCTVKNDSAESAKSFIKDFLPEDVDLQVDTYSPSEKKGMLTDDYWDPRLAVEALRQKLKILDQIAFEEDQTRTAVFVSDPVYKAFQDKYGDFVADEYGIKPIGVFKNFPAMLRFRFKEALRGMEVLSDEKLDTLFQEEIFEKKISNFLATIDPNFESDPKHIWRNQDWSKYS